MKLTLEQEEILSGKQGEVKAKMMETIVRYGDIFDAPCLVPVTHGCGHLVTSFGMGLLKPVFRICDEMIDAGLKVEDGFTMDPRPLDYKNVKCNPLEKLVFDLIMYGKQKDYEERLTKLGMKPNDPFSCSCYLILPLRISSYAHSLNWDIIP